MIGIIREVCETCDAAISDDAERVWYVPGVGYLCEKHFMEQLLGHGTAVLNLIDRVGIYKRRPDRGILLTS